MWREIITKLTKTEFFVTLAAMAGSALGKKLGIPDEALGEFILATTGLAVAYIGGRSGEKMIDARARSLSLVARPQPLPPQAAGE